MSLITDKFGFLMTGRTGPPIATAAGCMSPTMAGPGFPTSPGVGRRITTGAGSFMAVTGAGGLDRFMPDITRCGHLRTFPSSDSAEEAGELTSGSASAAGSETLAGCHAGLAIAFSHGTAGEETG